MDTNKFNEAMIAASIRAKDTGEKCYVFRIPPDDERLYVASTQEIERYPGNAHAIHGSWVRSLFRSVTRQKGYRGRTESELLPTSYSEPAERGCGVRARTVLARARHC